MRTSAKDREKEGQSIEEQSQEDTPFSFSGIGKHSLVYGVGIFANKAVALIMLPIYTRYLTPSDYGTLQLLTLLLEVAAIVAGARIAQGVYHFYHKSDSPASQSSVLTTTTTLLIATFGATAVATMALAGPIASFVFDGNGTHAYFVRLAVTTMALESLLIVPMAFLQIAKRSRIFVTVNLTKLAIQVTLNLVLIIGLGQGVAGVLISGLVANAVIGSFLTWMLLREHGWRPRVSIARDLVAYGYPLMITQVATMVLMMGDRFFLNRAVGASAVGLYGLAHQFAMLVVLFGYIPFEQVWNPTRFEIAARDDRDTIYQRAFTYLNILLISAAVGVSLFSHDVIVIMSAEDFHTASQFIPGLVIVFLFHAWTSFHNFGLLIAERTGWYAAANWIAAAMAVGGFLLLIPSFGAWGAVLTAGTAFGVRFVIVYRLSQAVWPVAYSWRPSLLMSVWGAAIVLLSRPLGVETLLTSIAIHLLLFLAFIVGLWLLPIVPEEDRAVLKSVLLKARTNLSQGRGAESD